MLNKNHSHSHYLQMSVDYLKHQAFPSFFPSFLPFSPLITIDLQSYSPLSPMETK